MRDDGAMKAVILSAPGGVENLQLTDTATPEPDAHEVRICVVAAGFNPSDYKMRQTASTVDVPVVLGGEVAGAVDAVGAEVSEFRVGDSVCAYLPLKRGGYAEAVCAHVAFVAKKPETISFTTAAAIPLAGLTAMACVGNGIVDANTPVFIAGGAGGVGGFAIEIARAAGGDPIITTAGTESSAGYLVQTLGVSPNWIVRYDQVNDSELTTASRSLNRGRLFPVAVDLVGRRMTKLCCDVVAFDGCATSIVQRPDTEDQERLSSKSAAFRFVSLRARAKSGDVAIWPEYKRGLTVLLDLISGGQIRLPKITTVGTLSAETVRSAHQLMEEKHTQGKLVMSIA